MLDRGSSVAFGVCRYHHKTRPWHSAEFVLSENLVVFVERGFFNAVIDGRAYRIDAGEVIWIPPGVRREFIGAKGVRVLRHYNVRFSLRSNGHNLAFLRDPQLRSQGWDLHSTLKLIHEWQECQQLFRVMRLRGLLVALATGFLNLPDDRGSRGRMLHAVQRRRIGRLLSERIAHGLEPTDLARSLDLSLDYFTRLFRNTYGVPPRTYLKQERMRLAAVRLSETRASVDAVAREFGQDNVSFFCRQFRSVMGCSPTEYRRRRGPEE
jgi:AraC-like DNA-binding protein